jgi:Zn-dependent protease/CBS domain-containing protein
MKWSFRVARVSGIDIRVHATFVLIVLYFAHVFGRVHGLPGAAYGAFLVCALFVCVVLHELGHSLVAQRFGVQVREIVLLPIGGVARLMRDPARPYQELLIAIAGPAVNVAIAIVLSVVGVLALDRFVLGLGPLTEHAMAPPSLHGLFSGLILGNAMVAVFNMIPALPMDGGRVFRAALAMLLDRRRATFVAGTIGQVIAASGAAYGIMKTDWVLTLIGAFIFLGATQERFAAEANAALSGLRAGDICAPGALVLSPGDLLGTVLELMLRTPQPYFGVVHGERVIGTLSRDDALNALRRVGSSAYVAAVMQRDPVEVDASTPLEQVRSQLVELGGRPLLVRGPNGYLGLIGLDDISRSGSLMVFLQRGRPRQTESRSGVSDA